MSSDVDSDTPKQRFFIFIQCKPGTTYSVGQKIAQSKKDLVVDVSSTSGEWDLLVLVKIDIGADVGREVASLFEDCEDIVRTNTIAAYRIEA